MQQPLQQRKACQRYLLLRTPMNFWMRSRATLPLIKLVIWFGNLQQHQGQSIKSQCFQSRVTTQALQSL